jgi:hypothetical protein
MRDGVRVSDIALALGSRIHGWRSVVFCGGPLMRRGAQERATRKQTADSQGNDSKKGEKRETRDEKREADSQGNDSKKGKGGSRLTADFKGNDSKKSKGGARPMGDLPRRGV